MKKVRLPDGSELEVTGDSTVEDIAYEIGSNLGDDAVAGEVNGDAVDLYFQPRDGDEVNIITRDSERGVDIIRHTASHIMAHAVKEIYNDVKLAIGPTTDDGFYYDFDLETTISSEDFPGIKEKMEDIIDRDMEIRRVELPREEAIELMEKRGEEYKLELIEELDDQYISFYRQGDFIDLCRGPHLPRTGRMTAFDLLSVAGAYWRGDEDNPMLQRIYGTAFATEEELDEHLEMLEEAKKRDHRKLGQELDLFSLHDEGKGFPFFHPKGMVIWNELLDFWREQHREFGYEEVKSPILLDKKLWKRSGHWDHYKDNMYFTEIDEDEHAVKPMNCPGVIKIYNSKLHSYRDFPIRLGELGLVHRHERSGTLHGLMRVRAFTQDDAHIFCLPSQIEEELSGVIELVEVLYSAFDFDYNVELSTKPDNAMGDDALWERATEALENAIVKNGLDYVINEGDGAFYGPKIDFNLEDCLGRTWQCGTIQLDFQMPERFDLTYIGEDDEEHRPVMIHRAIFGSIERFIGILIEHFGGAFPAWLAPVQAKVIPVSQDQHDYACRIRDELKESDIRSEVDLRDEQVSYKIREAQVEQVPYMIIVGSREEESGTVSVRHRREGDQGERELTEFIEDLRTEIEEKRS